MKKFGKFWPFLLIFFVIIIFFFPVFEGKIPFPGDILVSKNPYSTQSYLGYNPGAYPNRAQGPDVIYEIYPWRYFSVNQLKVGQVPFWNPHNFSGNPQMADFQTAIFYPLNILYFIFPFNISWTLIIMAQPLLAVIFMYLFLKKGVGLKDFSSIIGGISFGFCSYMTVWIEYGNIGNTILWLPLILLFTKYFFKKTDLKYLLGLILSFTLAILAGYIQGVFYIYALCFFYYNYLIFSSKDIAKNYKNYLLFLVSLFLPVLITAFQILPTLQLFSQSTRGAYSLSQIERNLAPLYNWLTIGFPDFFGNPATRNYWIDGTYIERVMYPGTVILVFLFYTFFTKVKFIEKKFFITVSIISLIIATNLPFVKYFYLIPIPLVTTTIPTREFSILIFSLIILGTIGLDNFLQQKQFQKKIIFFYLILTLFIWVSVFIVIRFFPSLSANLKISLRNLIIPSILIFLTTFSIFLKKINIKVFYALITFLVIFDLFYFFNKITPFAPASLTYPKTPIISYLKNNAGINRFWGYGSAYISANFQSVDNTYSPEGNDPLHILRYGELLAASVNGKFPKSVPRPDANLASGYGNSNLKNNLYRQRLLNLLGVKYVLNQDYALPSDYQPDFTTFPKNSYKLIWQKNPWQVYENKTALPRISLIGNYILAKNKEQAMALFYDKTVDLSKTIILEESPNANINNDLKGSVKLISYTPNEILVQTDVAKNSFLFISDNYYSDWRAFVDKTKSKIFIADYAFRAIEVPKGKHLVKISYLSDNFRIGIVISLISCFLISTYVIICIRKIKAK